MGFNAEEQGKGKVSFVEPQSQGWCQAHYVRHLWSSEVDVNILASHRELALAFSWILDWFR